MYLNPLVSIILPIRNERNSIAKTLDSIIEQDFEKTKLEIIISDGLSTDGTLSIIKRYQSLYPNIHIINNKKKTVPSGFNFALNIAKGDIIIRVDGHTVIAPNYISQCVKILKEKKATNVGGLMTPKSRNFLGNLITLATSSRFGVGNSYFHFSNFGRWVDTVYLGAWERTIFKNVGGFDEDLIRNQDDEFNFRTIQYGGKIWLDPSIKSIYEPRNTLIKLFSQYFQYGFYKVRVLQKRGGISSYRQLIPLFFVMLLLVSLFFLKTSIIPFSLILVPYVLSGLFSSIINLRRLSNYGILKKVYSLFVLPFIFFILHFSYGIGYLAGLGYFFNDWNKNKTYCPSFDQESFQITYNIKK